MEASSSSFSIDGSFFFQLFDYSHQLDGHIFFSLIAQTSTDIIRNLLHVQVICLFKISAAYLYLAKLTY